MTGDIGPSADGGVADARVTAGAGGAPAKGGLALPRPYPRGVGRVGRASRGTGAKGDPRKDRGAVAVEAAIVLPLLVTVLLGVIEVSMLLRAGVGLAAGVRSAARTASAEPRQPRFALDALDALRRGGLGVSLTQIDDVWIYRANAAGYPGPEGGSSFGVACTRECLRFRYDGSKGFLLVSGSWPADSIDACVGTAHAVGVRVVARHVPLSAGIIGQRSISQRAVMRFEPAVAGNGKCRP